MGDRIIIEGQDGAFNAYIARPKIMPAASMPPVPPIITTFLSWYRSICILLARLGLRTTNLSMSILRAVFYRRHRGRRGFDRRQVDASDLDHGLPRGFLAGAIVEVWVALRLNWA